MDLENDSSWVRSLLHPGESLLWTGRAEKGQLLRMEDAFLIPFSILWCGFAVFWEVSAIAAGVPYFWLVGIPFVFFGLYISVGRFVFQRLRDKKTRYALTDQRIIAKVGSRVNMLELANLPQMNVVLRKDGSGDIRFGEIPYYRGFGQFRSPAGLRRGYVLELRGIADANSVEYRIRTAADRAIRARAAEE